MSFDNVVQRASVVNVDVMDPFVYPNNALDIGDGQTLNFDYASAFVVKITNVIVSNSDPVLLVTNSDPDLVVTV